MLWARAAGRCQYDGCNQQLFLDQLTKTFMNSSYIAHIVADQPDGPRGHPVHSTLLASDISNLMLACDVHHRLMDVAQVTEHPVERLRSMKKKHEQRIELLTSLIPEKQSHVILYGGNIGNHAPVLSFQKAAEAMLPDWYPADPRAIEIGVKNSGLTDRDAAYWAFESANLEANLAQLLKPRLSQGQIAHLSIFAVAPQPLLMKLGSLLSDIPAARVYQLHREPAGWSWCDEDGPLEFRLQRPDTNDGVPALIFSLSGTVIEDRVLAVLPGASIWKIFIDHPHNDFVRSYAHTVNFRRFLRTALDMIKSAHSQASELHVFPAMPVSLAVEVGRVRMPKADLPLKVYDEDRNAGGFREALQIR
jgi:hypothetical protein